MNYNNSIFPYIGGKWRCADKIINLMPEHTIYIEPFWHNSRKFVNHLKKLEKHGYKIEWINKPEA